MPQTKPPDEAAQLECTILRTLCRRDLPRARWERFAQKLADYVWRVPDHNVVYAALLQIRSRDANTWRDQLPAQATRMGFPDVDWDGFFGPVVSPLPDIDEAIRRLIAQAPNQM